MPKKIVEQVAPEDVFMPPTKTTYSDLQIMLLLACKIIYC